MQGRCPATTLSIAIRSRRGRASSLGLIAVALLLGAGVVVAVRFAWSSRTPTDVVAVAPDSAPHGTREPERAPEPDAATAREMLPQAPPVRATDNRRSDTQGVIRGTVAMRAHGEFPASWQLVVEPSAIYSGATVGVRRSVDFEAGERDFRVDDLPLAGYAVHARAAGFNSLPVHLLLTEGSEHVIVSIELAPAGFLDGYARDDAGASVEGLVVTLENELTNVRLEATTGGDGAYVFENVLDGLYTIYFGDPESPLIEPGSLTFAAPSMRFPDATVPAAGELVITVRDSMGRAVEGAEVTGFGNNGGRISLTTDFDGRAVAKVLQAGTFRMFASTEDGRTGRGRVDVKSGATHEFELRVDAH